MNIVVTGGAGYIGSVTTALLLEAGNAVTIIDDLSKSRRGGVPEEARFIDGDIADLGKLIKPEDNIEAVIHLAAFIAAGESMKEPELYWRNNMLKTLELLSGLRALNIKKLIFASSAAVYGNPQVVPITEDSPKEPTNTYGMTKLAMDMAITSETWAHDLAAISLRFFNVAGAYKQFGERHAVETHLIPLALDAAARGHSLALFGTDYPTKDGTCVRDYIHVADLARAMLLALDTLEPGAHRIYNLGNGVGFTNREVLDAVQRVTGKTLTIDEQPRREGDPAELVASSQLAGKELGWRPERPALDDIITDAWSFYQAQKPVR